MKRRVCFHISITRWRQRRNVRSAETILSFCKELQKQNPTCLAIRGFLHKVRIVQRAWRQYSVWMHMILVARHGQFIEIEKSNQQNWNTNKQQVLRHLHGNPSGSTLPGDLKDFDTTNPPKRILKATRTAIVVETFRKSKRAHAEALERDEEEKLP